MTCNCMSFFNTILVISEQWVGDIEKVCNETTFMIEKILASSIDFIDLFFPLCLSLSMIIQRFDS